MQLPIITRKRKLDLMKVTQAISGFTTFEHESELVLRLETCFEGREMRGRDEGERRGGETRGRDEGERRGGETRGR